MKALQNKKQIDELQENGYGKYPVCVAKTQYSFSTDPTLRGAPSDHIITIREVRLAAGAEFIVMVCGDIMTMPGLPKVPAAEKIDLDENGNINKPYFASDSALEKFEDIIKQSDKKFFLASDSKELKNILKTKYPDKIVTLDHDISFTYEDDILKNYGIPEETIYACYLDWFLLSKCKSLYVSAGNEDMGSLSTFGYSAGAYGNSDIYIILN